MLRLAVALLLCVVLPLFCATASLTQIQSIPRPGSFGRTLARTPDGSFAVSAAPSASPPAVYVLQRQPDGTYTEFQVLRGTAGSSFGHSLAITDDALHLAIGDPSADGQVQVFSRATTTDPFPTMAQNALNGPAAGSGFGWSVAITPDALHLAVGAITAASNFGQVRVFSRATTTALFPAMAQNVLNGPSANSFFGVSVAITPDALHLAVGASLTSLGRVEVFSRATTTDLFPTMAQNALNGPAANSRFGFSVAITPDALHLAVGAIWPASNGQVRVFSRATTAALFPTMAQNALNGPAAGSQFGYSVAITPDALHLAVGAYAASSNDGQVQVFSRATTTDPFPTMAQQELTGPSPGSQLGWSVAFAPDASVLMAGAPSASRVLVYASPPVITTHPTSTTVAAGSLASFSVTAPTATAYQWQVADPMSMTFAAIPSETSATLNVPTSASGAEQGRQYRVIVTAPSGPVTSNVATLTLTGSAPTITMQPTSVTVTDGQPATFTVTASNVLSYQWQAGNPPTTPIADISGATSASYTIASTTAAMNGNTYQVVLTNAFGTTTSSAVTLTVTVTMTGSAPTIATQPTSVTVIVGQSATFTVASPDATGYQWQVDTTTATPLVKRQVRAMTNIPGATSASYTINPTTAAMNGNTYQVLVSNAFGTTPSSVVSLTLTASASLAGDPHVMGLDGRAFDFDGAVGGVYNLLADSMVHINALLGVVPATRDLNLPGHWITDMGVVTRCIALAVSAGRPIDSIDASLLLSQRRQAAGECSSVQSNAELQAVMSHDLRTSMRAMPSLAWTEIDPDTGDSVAVTLKLERLEHGVAASSFGLPSGSDRVIERLVLTIDQRLEVSMYLIEVGYSDVLHKWLVPLARRWLDLSVKVLDIGRKPRGILARSESDPQHGKRDATTYDQDGWQEQYRQADDNLFGEL